ncbi:MAG: hypothetical protein FWD17_13350 [Polyangiaceae bacterium]|nr:hypothetical protein [Polyangiaceae bacterium]
MTSISSLAEIVEAAKSADDLTVNQWVADCQREKVDWSSMKQPNVHGDDLSIAAALVELMAMRNRQSPPGWTRNVGPASVRTHHASHTRDVPTI